METKKEVYRTLSHLSVTEYVEEKKINTEYRRKKSEENNKMINTLNSSWVKKNYQPHLEIIKTVDRSTLIFKKYNTGTYFGQFNEEGLKEGLGVIFYSNGRHFEG